jgi:hypothetical protein
MIESHLLGDSAKGWHLMGSGPRRSIFGQALVSAAILGLVVGLFGVSADAESGEGGLPPRLSVLSDDRREAERADASYLAARFDIPVDVATEMILERLESQPVLDAIKADLDDTYAGLAIDYRKDGWGIIVWSTQKAANVQSVTDGTLLDGRVEIRTADFSLEDLRGVANRFGSSGVAQPFDLQVDVPTNRVVIYVLSTDELNVYLEETGLELPDSVVVEVVESLAFPATNASKGGITIYRDTTPDPTPEITTGFSVKSDIDGTQGVLTAGHLEGSPFLLYESGDLAIEYPILFGGNCDCRWFETVDLPDRKTFMVGPLASDWRYVYGRVSRWHQEVGDTVCKYGITTGYTCGDIASIDLDPGYYIDEPDHPEFEATFIRVDDPYLSHIVAGGDSGAPVFRGNDAYGIISGGIGTGEYNPTWIHTAINYPLRDLELDLMKKTP